MRKFVHLLILRQELSWKEGNDRRLLAYSDLSEKGKPLQGRLEAAAGFN